MCGRRQFDVQARGGGRHVGGPVRVHFPPLLEELVLGDLAVLVDIHLCQQARRHSADGVPAQLLGGEKEKNISATLFLAFLSSFPSSSSFFLRSSCLP